MTQIVLNIEEACLVPSLKQVLGAIKGVTINQPSATRRKAGHPSYIPVSHTSVS